MTIKSKVGELSVPSFYTRETIDNPFSWRPRWPQLFKEADKLVENEGVKPSVTDDLKIAVIPVDVQLTFCHSEFELFVGGRSGKGALDDTDRLVQWGYRNLKRITEWFPTMDTHLPWQIFHPAIIVDENGKHRDPTYPQPITLDDLNKGKWRICPRGVNAIQPGASLGAVEEYFRYYLTQLESHSQLNYTNWNFHAGLGSISHALVPALADMLYVHSIARGVNNPPEIKGGNTLTENYSVFQPELLAVNGRPIAQKNTKFLSKLRNYDAVVIAGQAKSHCVAWTIKNLLDELKADAPELVKKVYLLTDATSAVVIPGVIDFTDYADQKFAEFGAAGMNLVDTSMPIADWPGIDKSRLAA
jgi:nicotinamidase-related amidase